MVLYIVLVGLFENDVSIIVAAVVIDNVGGGGEKLVSDIDICAVVLVDRYDEDDAFGSFKMVLVEMSVDVGGGWLVADVDVCAGVLDDAVVGVIDVMVFICVKIVEESTLVARILLM